MRAARSSIPEPCDRPVCWLLATQHRPRSTTGKLGVRRITKKHPSKIRTRYIPLHPGALDRINEYLGAAGHAEEHARALFRPMKSNMGGSLSDGITANGVYDLVRKNATQSGFEIGVQALRATAATNALDHESDIAKVQEWLGHANIATTKIYDRRKTRPEDSPTFKVSY